MSKSLTPSRSGPPSPASIKKVEVIGNNLKYAGYGMGIMLLIPLIGWFPIIGGAISGAMTVVCVMIAILAIVLGRLLD